VVGVSCGETLDANDLNTSWINEAGLYKLILKSSLKSAEIFQDWVCSEVIPSIRKTGSYTSPASPLQEPLVKQQIKVIDYIRNEFPEPALGCVVQVHSHGVWHIVAAMGCCIGHATNNFAEFEAAVAALRLLTAWCSFAGMCV
jgi:hypothetical protein